jgi:predicted nuclease of predicted toxin-antitoxin system
LKFVADENVDALIVAEVRAMGHEVWSVAEQTSGVADEDVLQRASQRDAILVTADKDFGEMVFRQRRASTGVLLLRLGGLPSEAKARLVIDTLTEHGERLIFAFSVLAPQALRIRKAEPSS